jgi:hypothetical protein
VSFDDLFLYSNVVYDSFYSGCDFYQDMMSCFLNYDMMLEFCY